MASKVKKVKLKTHKGSKKRFKITGTGKVQRSKAGLGHLCGHKTRKRKRQLRKTSYLTGAIATTYARLLGA